MIPHPPFEMHYIPANPLVELAGPASPFYWAGHGLIDQPLDPIPLRAILRMQRHLPGNRILLPLPPTRELQNAELEQAELDGLMALHGQIHGHLPADLEDILQIPQVPESFYDRHGAVFEEEHLPVAGLRVAVCVHLAAGVFVRGEGGAAVEGDAAGDDDAVGFDDGFEILEEGAGERGTGNAARLIRWESQRSVAWMKCSVSVLGAGGAMLAV